MSVFVICRLLFGVHKWLSIKAVATFLGSMIATWSGDSGSKQLYDL